MQHFLSLSPDYGLAEEVAIELALEFSLPLEIENILLDGIGQSAEFLATPLNACGPDNRKSGTLPPPLIEALESVLANASELSAIPLSHSKNLKPFEEEHSGRGITLAA